jgi:ankyrin repeat protein
MLLDKYKKNALHYAVQTRVAEIVDMVIPHITDMNVREQDGETALHIATRLMIPEIVRKLLKAGSNPNIQENQRLLYPLHIAVYNGSDEIVTLLLEHGADINGIDIDGMTPLHHSAGTDKASIVKILLNYKPKNGIQINANITDVYHSIPLHLVFSNKKNNFTDLVELLIPSSNLNIPENTKNTCLHLICKAQLWKKYKEMLSKKKLNAIYFNNNRERPFDYIASEDTAEFVDLLVESYHYVLTTQPKEWMNDWEKECINDDKVCYDNIRKRITDLLAQKEIKCVDRTYPIKSTTKCLDVPVDEYVANASFTGFMIDGLAGITHLLTKHNALVTNMYLTPFDNNLCNDKQSIIQSSCEPFTNTCVYGIKSELLYIFPRIHDRIKMALSDNTINYIIIQLGLAGDNFAHANMIIYSKITNEMERFEPAGGMFLRDKMLDEKLREYFTKLIPNLKYVSPSEYMKTGFQTIDLAFTKYDVHIGDPGGFCLAWSYWYADMRLSYPSIKRDKLVKYIIDQFNDKNLLFSSVIRNYTGKLVQLRDQVFAENGIDINMYTNNIIPSEKYYNIVESFKKRIPIEAHKYIL